MYICLFFVPYIVCAFYHEYLTNKSVECDSIICFILEVNK